MGESKRRKETLGEQYGKEQKIAPWLPVTKTQATQFVQWSSTGAWAGIILLVVWWLTVRFIGPNLGWWQTT
jgi:p-aminobenzoyl-glutamate transporter AbgT